MQDCNVNQLQMVFTRQILSEKHGGSVLLRTYCRFFKFRPQDLDKQFLCSGDVRGACAPCPDKERCGLNIPKKPGPVAMWRKQEEEEDEGERYLDAKTF